MKTALTRIVSRIRVEADIAARAGQHDRLNQIADDLEAFSLAFPPHEGGDA